MLQFNFYILGVTLCFSGSLVIAWLFRSNFELYTLPILLTLIVGAYLDSFEDNGYVHSDGKPTSINSELPPVIHILLDGFIGADGLPPYPASEILRDEIKEFFEIYNFQIL